MKNISYNVDYNRKREKMKKLLSFIEWTDFEKEYKSKIDFKNSLKKFGLDGIEIVRTGDYDFVPKDFITGIHLPFFTSWVDYYTGLENEVIKEFGSLEESEKFYGYKKENFYKYFQNDLEFSEKYCEYSVFHIGNTTSLEYLSGDHHLSDLEVIDASIKLINEILENFSYNKYFLMENLYFPGLQFNDINLTKKLIENINYEKKGFMLDIGHLMNSNPEIKNEDEGWDFVESVIDNHKELIDYFLGIHLHVSVSGENIKKYRNKNPKMAKNFQDRFSQIYDAVENIDTHSISKSKKAKKVIEKINPKYLVLEFKSENRKEREENIKLQLENLR